MPALSGHRWAWAQGTWIGVAYAVVPLLGATGGEWLALPLWLPLAAVLLLAPPAFLVDVVRSRRASHPVATWALAAACAALLLVWVLPWLFASGVLPSDEPVEALLPAFAFLLLAERAVAHGWQAWHDRALAAACGLYTAAAFAGGAWDARLLPDGPAWDVGLAWALLLGQLALPLPGPARVTLALLASLPALALGQFIPGLWTARAIEWAAWLGYGTASLLAWRHRAPGQPALAAPRPAAEHA